MSGALLFDRLGGGEAVSQIVERFYDLVESDYPRLRAMLPADTSVTRRKLVMYLTGWSGGPQLYVEAYGHPRLRMRHGPFAIDADGVADWLAAMGRAVDDAVAEGVVAAEAAREFLTALTPLAWHMQNR